MTPEEVRKIIREEITKIFSYKELPFNVERTLIERLKLGDTLTIATSAVDPATFTQAVDEAGSGTYNVAKVMTGFKTLTDLDGNSYTVATYD